MPIGHHYLLGSSFKDGPYEFEPAGVPQAFFYPPFPPVRPGGLLNVENSEASSVGRGRSHCQYGVSTRIRTGVGVLSNTPSTAAIARSQLSHLSNSVSFLQFSKMPPPPKSQHAGHEDQGPMVEGVVAVLTVLSCVAVALRFWARHLAKAGYWYDDWFALAGLFVVLASNSTRYIRAYPSQLLLLYKT
jgi:hypothetical protein